MKHRRYTTLQVWTALAGILMASAVSVHGLDTNLQNELLLLKRENKELHERLKRQEQFIQKLAQDVAELRQESALREDNLHDELEQADPSNSGSGLRLGKTLITGEGAVGFFNTGSQGAFPNSEFRVDEAKLFVEAPIWEDVYAFVELNLATHEANDLDLRLGELYLDFEDVSKLWGKSRQANLRIGRFDIPFGEEYLTRDAIDNPLISHSLADLWGVDEGIELYGSFGRVSYVVAVQNGGVSVIRDFDSDKSVAGRISFDPTSWLHLSVSGMRTGNLDVERDHLSEVWFGGGWFRSLGSTNTTRFCADLVQGDAVIRLPRGHIGAFGGYIAYDDDDPSRDNHRDVYYYSIEAVHDVTRKLYAGARFSQVFADGGFPIVGNSNIGDYLFGPLTDELWRLSLGLGYRFSRHLVIKGEYTIERGTEAGGPKRNHQDLFAAEAAFAF